MHGKSALKVFYSTHINSNVPSKLFHQELLISTQKLKLDCQQLPLSQKMGMIWESLLESLLLNFMNQSQSGFILPLMNFPYKELQIKTYFTKEFKKETFPSGLDHNMLIIYLKTPVILFSLMNFWVTSLLLEILLKNVMVQNSLILRILKNQLQVNSYQEESINMLKELMYHQLKNMKVLPKKYINCLIIKVFSETITI